MELLGTSPAMHHLRDAIARAAQSHAPVLILGETGSGKELVARSIHDHSLRRHRPLVTIDCGTLTDELAPSELFGTRRGAYTGASSDRQGLLAAAHQGTLFLDEIGNLSHRVQGMLLRVLQEQRVRRLGDQQEQVVDVRVLSATNASPDTFRPDLLYRLNTLTIHVPPLRERASDLPTLADAYLHQLNRQYGRRSTISPAALERLQAYPFPGNVRELQQLLHRAYLAADATIHPTHLQLPHQTWEPPVPPVCQDFWRDLAAPYHQRRITRDQLTAAIHEGLKVTKGNYRKLLTHFGLPATDYKRFMDFLRRQHCNLDYRPYRRDS